MARYIKANPKVAQYLHVENERLQVKDGNYLLWQADIAVFGPLFKLAEICEEIGAIALTAAEARQEQDGTVTRPLPEATRDIFKMPKPEEKTEEAPENVEAETSEEGGTTDHNEGEDAPESNSEEDGEGDADPEPENEKTEEDPQPEETDEAKN